MTTWILLRGLTREAAHWGGFVDQLAAAVPGAEPVTIDMPGTGSRRGVASPWRLGAVTDACREHWRSRGRKGRVALVGLSLGAMAVADWAQRFPDEVDRAVLINPSMRRFGAPWQRLRPGSWWPLLRVLMGGDARCRTCRSAMDQCLSGAPPKRARDLDGGPADSTGAAHRCLSATGGRGALRSANDITARPDAGRRRRVGPVGRPHLLAPTGYLLGVIVGCPSDGGSRSSPRCRTLAGRANRALVRGVRPLVTTPCPRGMHALDRNDAAPPARATSHGRDHAVDWQLRLALMKLRTQPSSAPSDVCEPGLRLAL